jgi:hypothetical protein
MYPCIILKNVNSGTVHCHEQTEDTNYRIEGIEGLTAVVMKSSVFWDTMPCSLLKVNWRFGRTCHLHPQGQRISQARNQHEAGSKQSLLRFFDPEDGGNMFLQNAGWLSMDYMALYWYYSSSNHWSNFKYMAWWICKQKKIIKKMYQGELKFMDGRPENKNINIGTNIKRT